MLQGGYLDVNRGSGNRNGWNSIIGRFVISKSTNSVRIVAKNIVRCDGATNMCGRERYRNFEGKYSKENIHLEDTFSDRKTQTQYTVENWS